jgi:tetratricopeptide (TPR) repeat protein
MYQVRGLLQQATAVSAELFQLAERLHNDHIRLQAHHTRWFTAVWKGEWRVVQAHTEQGLELYYAAQRRSGIPPPFFVDHDPGMCGHVMTAALWYLGYPDTALEHVKKAFALVQSPAHPPSLAAALFWAAIFHRHRREETECLTYAEDTIALAEQEGFALNSAVGRILKGWVLACQEHGNEGLGLIEQGLETLRSMEAKIGWTYWLALRSEVYGSIGRFEDGLHSLSEAFAEVEERGEWYYQAELYRLRGALLLEQNGSRSQQALEQNRALGSSRVQAEAEQCFQQAIKIARRQKAKSLELRATTSLSQLWRRQGKQTDARKALSSIYRWFQKVQEGLATRDVQEAKALLEVLS